MPVASTPSREADRLRASETLFRSLSESAPLGIFLFDANGGCVYQNPALAVLTGRSFEENAGRRWTEATHPEDRAAVRADWERAAAGGRTWSNEHRLLRPDGSVRWVRTLAAPQKDGQGRITGYVGTIEDITDRRIAEVAMLESEERYRQLLTLSPDAHFAHVDGIITLANPAFCQLMGATAPDQLIGQPALKFIHPDFHPLANERRRRHDEGLSLPAAEMKFLRLDGTPVDVELVGVALEVRGRKEVHVIIRDISSRKAAEAALRASEERYRTILMLSPDAQYVHVDGHITLVNPAFCRLLGADQPAQLLGKSIYEILHPDCHALVRARLKSIYHGQPAPALEEKFVRLDGTVVEVEVAAMAFDFRGRQEVQVMARDISTRKRGAEKLREQAALLEAQLDSSIDGIVVLDRQGRKVLQNQRCIDLFKIPGEVLGQSNEQQVQFVVNRAKHPQQYLEKLLYLGAHPDETSRDEIELVDGTVLDRYSAPVLGKEGINYGRIWTFRDITERKMAEAALRESEERFKLVARAVSNVVWDWNLATQVRWWSDGFQTTFGYAASEVEPGPESWTSRLHPEERERLVASIHQAIDSGAESWSGEYRFRRKDGSYAFVEDRGFILRDAAGKALRMVGGLRDLTEERKREMQNLRAQRMESIGTLAGGIAHDLNNVLAPILMSIELLKLDLGTDPQRLKILDTIHASARRGADLVRQVLSFSRGLDSQRIALNLRHLVDELEHIISETFPRNIRITTALPNGLWPIMGDPTQLHQVLLNLAVNARDAMPGGGDLTLTAANVTLDAQYAGTSPEAKPGTYVVLQVTDTGEGIPPEIRDRIFEPFFTTKAVGTGTGLGLATVHTVVKSHGGFVTIDSEVGHGTTFKIYLPAKPRSSVNATPVLPPDLPRGKGELVLVVDDEFSIRHITQQTLEAFGYRVETAKDGSEAVALYARHVQDVALVIIDMMMPVMDGTTTIQVLRRLNPSVRIIAASGLNVGDNVAKAAGVGVKDFLPKPYAAETLLKLMRQVLDAPAV